MVAGAWLRARGVGLWASSAARELDPSCVVYHLSQVGGRGVC